MTYLQYKLQHAMNKNKNKIFAIKTEPCLRHKNKQEITQKNTICK